MALAACAASAGAHAALVREHITAERALGVVFVAAALALAAAAVLLVIATKLVEALGLVFALQLIPTKRERGALSYKEARPCTATRPPVVARPSASRA